MENQLYKMMGELGGMEIPLNQPSGGSRQQAPSQPWRRQGLRLPGTNGRR